MRYLYELKKLWGKWLQPWLGFANYLVLIMVSFPRKSGQLWKSNIQNPSRHLICVVLETGVPPSMINLWWIFEGILGRFMRSGCWCCLKFMASGSMFPSLVDVRQGAISKCFIFWNSGSWYVPISHLVCLKEHFVGSLMLWIKVIAVL